MGNTSACTQCTHCPAGAAQVFDEISPFEIALETEPSFLQHQKCGGLLERRPFIVCVERVQIGLHWNNLGVLLCSEDSPTAFTLDEISEFGLLPDWNEKQANDITKVRAGDMINQIDGFSGSCDELMEKLTEASKSGKGITLLIQPGPESFGKFREATRGAYINAGSSNHGIRKPRALEFPELERHFAILDLAQDSSDEAIRRHYRRLARLWHPDKNPENIDKAKQKFQAINSAYVAIKEKLHL